MTSKRKPPAVLARPVAKQSAKAPSQTNLDESRTAVKSGHAPPASSQAETVEISSDSSSNYEDLSDSEEGSNEDGRDVSKASAPKAQQSMEKNTPPPDPQRVNGGAPKNIAGDSEMGPPEDEQAEGDASDTEAVLPTFGDLIRGTTTVDVPSAQPAQQATPLSTTQPQALVALPSANSLGTVLNQALRTNDNDLLESCLRNTDHAVVTNTINRMESALAGKLLEKLAARMHNRPGRALGLMRWIQGTLIAHGGALAAQGDLMRKLAGLSMVLEERSRGLTSLLALKGKLDMLDAQLKLRKTMAGAKRKFNRGQSDDEEESTERDEEEGIIYVEGEEDEEDAGRVNGLDATGQREGLDEKDDFVANGLSSDSEDDSSDEDDDDVQLLEKAGPEGDDEVDHDDMEEGSGEDESDGDEPSPPTKVQKVSSSVFKRK